MYTDTFIDFGVIVNSQERALRMRTTGTVIETALMSNLFSYSSQSFSECLLRQSTRTPRRRYRLTVQDVW